MAEVTSPEVQKYSTLVKLQPDNPEAHFRLGFAHEDAGNTAEAVKHYEVAIKLQPRHAMSYLHRGFLFAKGGELQLALQEWAKAFEYDPHLHVKFTTPELRPIYTGKFDQAIQQLTRPIVINPKDAFAHYQLGTAYKYFQKPELALQSLKRALEINPDLWEAHFQCGEIFSQLGQNKLAISSFQRAIDGNSRYADSHYQLGLIYEKENMSALALRHVERAIELDSEVSKYHFALGRIFMKQTKFKHAMKQYQRALDLDPTDARIHLRLAECCKQMYRPDLAISCYEKAVELDPDSSEAVYELGTTALQLGDIDRAITGFRKALELNPQDAYAHYSLAQAYHRQKDFEAAATHYGESARLNPKDAFAAYNLGLMRDELGQAEQAIEAYQRAVELKPHDAQYHLNLGRAYLKANRPQEAASELKQAIKLNPNDLETNFQLADVHMATGQFDEAINLYRKVVELNPQSVEARFRMAQAFQTLDMPDYAFEAFQETVRLDPRHFEALHGLGHIYLTNRTKPSIAVDFFQQALDVEPSHAPSMVSLGDAYMQLGQPDRALQFFERKLEENRDNIVFVSKYCLALCDSGHADKASEEIRVALQLNPESVELRRTLAVLLEKQGRAQDAMDAWRTAVRLDENDAASLFGFAKALKAGGNDTEAAQHLERVVNLDPKNQEAKDLLASMIMAQPTPTPTAAPVPPQEPAAPAPAESTDPFDFIGAGATGESSPEPVPTAPASEDPFATPAPTAAAEDPFSTPAPAAPAEDPFSTPAPAAPAEDPFSTPAPAAATPAEDPFSAPAPAAPAEDPFSTPAPAEVASTDDPFSAPAPAEAATADDPFTTPAPAEAAPTDDPFATPAPAEAAPTDDPFATPAPAEAATADDPFATPAPAEAATTDDPFATPEPAQTEDPFATPAPTELEEPTQATVDDPFAGSEPVDDAPGTVDDPFAGSEPVEEVPTAVDDPFATPPQDPFAADTGAAAPAESPGEYEFEAKDGATMVTGNPFESNQGTIDPFATAPPETTGEENEAGQEAYPFASGEEGTQEPPAPTAEPVSAAPAGESDFPAEDMLQQAILANVTGQSDEAEKLFQSILEQAPDYAPAYFHFGQYQRSQGNGEKAVELFKAGLSKAEAQDNEDLVGQISAELRLTAQGGDEAAEQSTGDSTEAQAEEAATEATESSPEEVETPAEVAETPAEAQEAPAEAAQEAEEATETAQVEPEAVAEEAPAEAEAEQPANKDTVADDSTTQPTVAEQLESLENIGSYDAAAVLWENVEPRNPAHGQRIFFTLADSQAADGEHGAALETIARFAALAPDHEGTTEKIVEIEAARASSLAGEQKFEEALGHLKTSLETHSGNETLQSAVADIQRKQRDHALESGSENALELARDLASQSEEDKAAYVSAVKKQAETLAESDLDASLALVDGESQAEGAPAELAALATDILMTHATKAKADGEAEKAKELAQKVLERSSDHADAQALLEQLAAEEVPEWKAAEDSGDLETAASQVPEGDEHEEDRHRIYGALVAKHREADEIDKALEVASTWLQKVGEEKQKDVQGVRREIFTKQLDNATGDALVAAFDNLKTADIDESEWQKLLLDKIKAGADDQEQTKALLAKVELENADDDAKAAVSEAWLGMAKAALDSDDVSAAEEHLAAAMAVQENEATTELSKSIAAKQAQALIDDGKHEEAVALVNESSLDEDAKKPLLVAALLGQAQAAKAAEETDKATELFEKVKELEPENEAVVAHFAELEASLSPADVEAIALPDDLEEAIEVLKEKLAANAKDYGALKAAYEKLGTKANARKLIDLFRELQKKNSDNPDYLLSLARAYSHVGKDTLAVVQFRKLLSSDPQPEVYLDLTRAYRRLKKMADAGKTLELALAKLPDHPGPVREKVVISSLNDDHATAAEAAREGMKMVNITDDDREWFEKAAAEADAGNVLSDELQEVPSPF